MSLTVQLAISLARRLTTLTWSLFIPSGSDRLITSDGNVFKVRD